MTYFQLRGDSRELECLSAALVVFYSSVPKTSTREPEIKLEKLKDSHPSEYGQTSIVSSVADFARILMAHLCGSGRKTLHSVVP